MWFLAVAIKFSCTAEWDLPWILGPLRQVLSDDIGLSKQVSLYYGEKVLADICGKCFQPIVERETHGKAIHLYG